MAWSTPVTVGTATPSATSPITIAYSGVIGRLYVLAISRSTAADPFTGVTDNGTAGGNTWTQLNFAPTSGTAGRRIEMWVCVPTKTFTTVSIAFTGAGTAYGTLVEATGQDGTLNVNAADFRTASTTPAAVTVTPTEANMLVISICQANSNTVAQMTPSAGWTSLTTNTAGPAVVYQINPPSGVALGVSWTFVNSVGSGHSIAAFEMAAGGPPPAGLTVQVWNGTTAVAATIEGVWNGSTVVPATFEQVTP